MNLTRNAFELLSFLERRGSGKYTQRQLAAELSCSVGIINKILKEFLENSYITIDNEITITRKGLEILEPYRVKRAIIIAAGFSERLAPITFETPKPLVTIHGTRIIDTIIDNLLAVGIEDISIIVGYKEDAFKVLLDKYPSVTLLYNPLFNQSGNITSLYTARDKIEQCYICDADLYINHSEVFRKYEYSSCFLGTPVLGTDDWCFIHSGSRIHHISRGGDKCYKAIFIAYFNTEDGIKLQRDLQTKMEQRGGKECWWFDCLFSSDSSSYSLDIRNCYPEEVYEIDTIGDLIALDNSYSSISL